MEKMLQQNGKKFPTKIICCVKNAQQNIHLFINIITMIAYKIKGANLCKDENWFNYIKIRLVEKFVDWKYDKFIPLKQAVDIINNAVIYDKDIDSIQSKSEIKKKKKQVNKQNLINSILLNM